MSKLLAAAALSAAFLLPAPASAIENFTWSTPTGLLFFGSGFLPPTTDVGAFGLRTVGASADSLYDQSAARSRTNSTCPSTSPRRHTSR